MKYVSGNIPVSNISNAMLTFQGDVDVHSGGSVTLLINKLPSFVLLSATKSHQVSEMTLRVIGRRMTP